MRWKKTGFLQCVIEAAGLDDGMVKGKWTPSKKRPLFKDDDDKNPSGMLIYSSVVGINIYLSDHTCAAIAFAVNCYAQ